MATSNMTRGVATGPARWGLWLITVAGLLIAAIFTYWTAAVGELKPATDPQTFADYATSIGGLGSGIAYLVGIVLLLFGVLSLYGVVAGDRERVLALAGLVLQVASLSALLAALGAAALGGAIVAALYEGGQTGVAPALVKFNGGTFGAPILAAFLVGAALALLGAISTGIAVWRSGTLPRWSAIVFGLGFVLFAASVPLITSLGGILLAIASVGMARALAREAPAGALEVRPA